MRGQGFGRSRGLLAKALYGFGDTLTLRDAVERLVIRVKRTYIIVRFRIRRAAGGGEIWVLAAKLLDLLWTGTVAASAVQAELAITSIGNIERACIIRYFLANVSLSGCSRSSIRSASVDCNTAATYMID